MLVRIVCLLMELLKLQGYRSRVLHVSASRSDRYRVALRDLLEGRITTSTAPSHDGSCQSANEQQK